MILKGLLNKIDIDAVAWIWAKRFFREDYFPKPKISIEETKERLKKIIADIVILTLRRGKKHNLKK